MPDMPWSKFFWSDWESDQGLRLCSLAAQGLWMRMLCVCARHDPKGYLSINGNPLKIDAIARLAGVAETEAEILVAELELNGVFSRNRSGCIFSRRMVKDEKRSQEGRKNKKRGLSQVIEKPEEISHPSRVPTREPSPQKLEARSQKEKEELRSSKKKGCRIPDGFMPDIAWAKAQGLPEQSALLEAEKFRNYWQAKTGAGATKLDWPATWRTWVLNSLERRGIERVDASRAATEDVWQTRLSRARAMQTWPTDEFGPKPGREGCQVPSRLLQPGDGEGWGEWKRSAA